MMFMLKFDLLLTLHGFRMKMFSQFGEAWAVNQIPSVIPLDPVAFTLISMDLRPFDRYPSPPGINPAESLEHRMWDVDNHSWWNPLISYIPCNDKAPHGSRAANIRKWLPFVWRFVFCVRKPRSILRSSICFVEFIDVAWQVAMRFNDMPLLHAAAEGLWSTSQTRTLQKMGRSDSVLSSWFCHLDNSSGGRKLLDFCTYRSDGIQFPIVILCEAEGASSFTFV